MQVTWSLQRGQLSLQEKQVASFSKDSPASHTLAGTI